MTSNMYVESKTLQTPSKLTIPNYSERRTNALTQEEINCARKANGRLNWLGSFNFQMIGEYTRASGTFLGRVNFLQLYNSV